MLVYMLVLGTHRMSPNLGIHNRLPIKDTWSPVYTAATHLGHVALPLLVGP